MYYTCKVKLVVDSDKGTKKVTEHYLVRADSIVEADIRLRKDFEGYGGDYEVISIVQSNIVKLIDEVE